MKTYSIKRIGRDWYVWSPLVQVWRKVGRSVNQAQQYAAHMNSVMFRL